MKTDGKKNLIAGFILIFMFVMWTVLVVTADVKPAGVNGTDIGFAEINTRFHNFTGVDMKLYNITDWLGLVPLFVCMLFGFMGFLQLIKRKNILRVDKDIVILGIYYVIVILCYLIFEMIPVNYRPVLINGLQEISYPSSTTLLVLSVMPTLVFQVYKRLKGNMLRRTIFVFATVFCIFMMTGRLISGVHWLTDIVASVFISTGLFLIYKGTVLSVCKE